MSERLRGGLVMLGPSIVFLLLYGFVFGAGLHRDLDQTRVARDDWRRRQEARPLEPLQASLSEAEARVDRQRVRCRSLEERAAGPITDVDSGAVVLELTELLERHGLFLIEEGPMDSFAATSMARPLRGQAPPPRDASPRSSQWHIECVGAYPQLLAMLEDQKRSRWPAVVEAIEMSRSVGAEPKWTLHVRF